MIRRLYIHNFRCFENFELSLDGARSVLLLGQNGAGKTTVGLALELLQRIARGANRVGDLVKPRDFANGRVNTNIRIEVEADLAGEAYLYSIAFDLPPNYRESHVREEKLLVSGRPVFISDSGEVRTTLEDQASSVIFRIDWHLVALPIIQEQSPRDPLSIFKTWLRSAVILRPVPSLFGGISDGVGSEDGFDTRAVQIGAWFTSMIATSPNTYSRVDEYLRQVMPDFSKITNELVGRETRSLLFHFESGQQKLVLELDQLSDGEKCFVLYSLVIASNAERGGLLCFWDEPDNYLAPDEVGQSIMGLRRAFRDSGQLLIASHNPAAIRRFSEDDTFFLARRSRLEPPSAKTVKTLRESNAYEGSFVDALLRGDIGAGADG